MRKADFEGDYEDALIAAWQAAGNAQLLSQATALPQSAPGAAAGGPGPDWNPCKDNTPTQPSSWSDGLMQHYITPQGTHVQIRLDLARKP